MYVLIQDFCFSTQFSEERDDNICLYIILSLSLDILLPITIHMFLPFRFDTSILIKYYFYNTNLDNFSISLGLSPDSRKSMMRSILEISKNLLFKLLVRQVTYCWVAIIKVQNFFLS